MRQLILFFVTAGLVYLVANPNFAKLVDSMAGQALSKGSITFISAVLVALLVVLIDNAFPCVVKEGFAFADQRYSTVPQNQYVAMDDYYGSQFFTVPTGLDRVNQPRFDHFTKYFIGRNEGALRKYSSAQDKPAACAYVAAGGKLNDPAKTVFEGKPFYYYATLSQNAGMPLWNVPWKK